MEMVKCRETTALHGGRAEMSWGQNRLTAAFQPGRWRPVTIEHATRGLAALLGRLFANAWNIGPIDFLDALLKRVPYADQNLSLRPRATNYWELKNGKEELLVRHELLCELSRHFGCSDVTWTEASPHGHTSDVAALEHRIGRLHMVPWKKPSTAESLKTNRRNGTRIETFLAASHGAGNAIVLDLSRTGLQLLSDSNHNFADPLQLDIALRTDCKVSVMATQVWCRKTDGGRLSGCSFKTCKADAGSISSWFNSTRLNERRPPAPRAASNPSLQTHPSIVGEGVSVNGLLQSDWTTAPKEEIEVCGYSSISVR